MKQFFKFMFASIAGFFISTIILVILFLAMIASIMTFAEQEIVDVKENTLLSIKLNQPIYERTDTNPFNSASLFSLTPSNALGLNDILKNIEKAKYDDNISGIYL